jgi:CheY-like chemotaxis protein
MTAMPEGVMWDITLPYTCKESKRQNVGQAQPGIKAGRDVDASSLKGRRVLVVEDEPLIGLDIMAALEDAGAVAEGPVSTIAEALDIIERSSFDAALVDANLHGKPVDAIAAALVERNVPFAFATGYGRDGLPAAYRDVPILSKPCSPEQVVEMTARLVSGGSPRI